MKKLFLILLLMFSITLVSAETGYGCPQEINFTEVINNSGNIEVVYETSCVSSDDVSVGISVFNGVTGNGANCPKLNTTYENNSYHIVTACVYPTYNENLTFKVSITCSGCTPFPATLEINNTPVEEVNETEPEVTPTPTPTPTKKKSSGGGSRTVKCEEWTVCTDGTQTQQCGNNVVKSRACESVEVNQTVVEPTEEIIDTPTTITQEFCDTDGDCGTWTEEVEEPRSYAWVWWFISILAIIAIIVAIIIRKKGL